MESGLIGFCKPLNTQAKSWMRQWFLLKCFLLMFPSLMWPFEDIRICWNRFLNRVYQPVSGQLQKDGFVHSSCVNVSSRASPNMNIIRCWRLEQRISLRNLPERSRKYLTFWSYFVFLEKTGDKGVIRIPYRSRDNGATCLEMGVCRMHIQELYVIMGCCEGLIGCSMQFEKRNILPNTADMFSSGAGC